MLNRLHLQQASGMQTAGPCEPAIRPRENKNDQCLAAAVSSRRPNHSSPEVSKKESKIIREQVSASRYNTKAHKRRYRRNADGGRDAGKKRTVALAAFSARKQRVVNPSGPKKKQVWRLGKEEGTARLGGDGGGGRFFSSLRCLGRPEGTRGKVRLMQACLLKFELGILQGLVVCESRARTRGVLWLGCTVFKFHAQRSRVTVPESASLKRYTSSRTAVALLSCPGGACVPPPCGRRASSRDTVPQAIARCSRRFRLLPEVLLCSVGKRGG